MANLAHSHQLVVGPELPAVDKLRAVEVLVPNVKAAEDFNLRPVTTAPASLGARLMLHAPHQPLNLTFHRGASPCTLHAHYAHYAHFSKLARPPKIKL